MKKLVYLFTIVIFAACTNASDNPDNKTGDTLDYVPATPDTLQHQLQDQLERGDTMNSQGVRKDTSH